MLSDLREIAQATNQSAATGVFEGEDPNTGLYRYKNPITGNSFLSGTAPTAEQQAASGVSLVPPDTTPPPNPPPTAAAAVAASPAGATQNPAPPPEPPPVTTERLTTTQAATLAANTDAGTNAPVKTLVQTQSVPPANTVVQPQSVPAPTSTPSPANSTEGRPGGAPGAGAGEDSGQTASNTRRILNTFNNTRFVPKNNILDQYASYTYNIAWYLMPRDGLDTVSAVTQSSMNTAMNSYYSIGTKQTRGDVMYNSSQQIKKNFTQIKTNYDKDKSGSEIRQNAGKGMERIESTAGDTAGGAVEYVTGK